MKKQAERRFSEEIIERALLKFPEGATPAMLLEVLGSSWNTLTRRESQQFTSALGRLYRKRRAYSLHVYSRFIEETNRKHELPKKSHHTRLIFHSDFVENFRVTEKEYSDWEAEQPLPTKQFTIGRKYKKRALDAVESEGMNYQPRSVAEAKLPAPLKTPTADDQKRILFELFDHGCTTPAKGASTNDIDRWTRLGSDLIFQVLNAGATAQGAEEQVFERNNTKNTWYLTTRGKQRVAEIRFGAIEFVLDESIVGVCLNKWNRKAIHFITSDVTVEDLAITIGYVWDDERVLPNVARRYAVEEISRMVKTLQRYEILRADEHELMPGMTRIREILKPDVLHYLRYLALCIEHLHTLLIEDETCQSLLRSIISVDKVKEMLENDLDMSKRLSLGDLLSTGFFASPNPLQLVTKYVPNLAEPDPGKLELMTNDFEQIIGDVESRGEFVIKRLGSQYWIMKRAHGDMT